MHMKRSEAREIAFQAIYEAGFETEKTVSEIYASAIEARGVAKTPYAEKLIACVDEHRAFINDQIDTYAVGWKRNRISRVSLSILTLACAEIYFFEDVPRRVSLNEAVELAKKYDDDKAYGFVNGVLNAMVHDEKAVGEE